jgi:hypothetical protein
MMRFLFCILSTLTLVATVPATAAGAASHVGVKTCTKCHDVHGESWAATAHAKAFESLQSGTKAEVKKKAKLDASKDYTKDKDCLGCHSTGFGQPGGYEIGTAPGGAKALGSVGCESCHGAGGGYRDEHSKAEKKFKKTSEATPRKTLVAAGQNFDYERACATCHLNYEGSPYKHAKRPYTPFTPAVDPKYRFDFNKAMRSKALHEHYKLKGVYAGDPVPSMRAEFQKSAKELPE